MKRKNLDSLISSSSSSFKLLSILTLLVFLSETTSGADPHYEACEPRNCGNQRISYPFWIADVQPPYCGYPGFKITCRQDYNPILHIPENDYLVHQILYDNQYVRVSAAAVLGIERNCKFPPIRNLSVQDNIFTIASNVSHLYLFSNCSSPLPQKLWDYKILNCSSTITTEREDDLVLAMFENDRNLSYALEECKRDVLAPVELHKGDDGVGVHNYTDVLTRGFALNWRASNCSVCQGSGGRCGFDLNNSYFKCFCPDRPHFVQCNHKIIAGRRNYVKWILIGTVIPGGIILLCMLIIWRHKKWNHVSYSRNTSSDPSSKADLEGGGIFFGVPVYSYIELEEATNNFDPSKELGDGGFGTVYHGKLRDGREVAVKRLYEHNYKRVTQFINEIEILTRLRHPNLVSLYGCTSRHCRELLLVYEYIPNGTVADHLHGDRARDGSLTWPIRMNIAIETASALAYLHASDIIHRDVKTNNILLDNNFSVKVADFGLSRLFPNDVTHVSTAPQGTPGYVDPEYHQCYQLTNKSDVYSFGVVLTELISSMPAVDISRHRHEINLANLAMNRIQHRAFNELIDPSFGFESDSSIERMTTSMAEVAFRCLQLEKEMRPTMDEVLEALKEIQEYHDENTTEVNTKDVDVLTSKQPPPSPEGDHVGLLLKDRKVLTSPDSVTNIWNSGGSTTTSISSG